MKLEIKKCRWQMSALMLRTYNDRKCISDIIDTQISEMLDEDMFFEPKWVKLSQDIFHHLIRFSNINPYSFYGAGKTNTVYRSCIGELEIIIILGVEDLILVDGYEQLIIEKELLK